MCAHVAAKNQKQSVSLKTDAKRSEDVFLRTYVFLLLAAQNSSVRPSLGLHILMGFTPILHRFS
jgi:hypothetical protein